MKVCKAKISGKDRYVNDKVVFVQGPFHLGNILLFPTTAVGSAHELSCF